MTRIPLVASIVLAASLPTSYLDAQVALSTPFIGANTLAFQASGMTRSGGEEMVTLFGALYGRRLRREASPTQVAVVASASARALVAPHAGVLDLGASLNIWRQCDPS
jgi:hypothetical protein